MGLKILFYIFLGFLLSPKVFGQSKFEKEYRIKDVDIPGQAIDFMDSSRISSNIKWFREESQDGISVEAKFSYLKANHSIEFDTLGNVLDMEVERTLGDLETGLKKNIIKALDSLFSKYKISKTQAQWTGSRQDHLQRLWSGESVNSTAPRYEIVVKGKKDGSSRYYEVLLEADGHVVNMLPITIRSAYNLDF